MVVQTPHRHFADKMRSYRSYLAFILVPYVILIFVFHSQLDINQGVEERVRGAGTEAGFQFRDLRVDEEQRGFGEPSSKFLHHRTVVEDFGGGSDLDADPAPHRVDLMVVLQKPAGMLQYAGPDVDPIEKVVNNTRALIESWDILRPGQDHPGLYHGGAEGKDAFPRLRLLDHAEGRNASWVDASVLNRAFSDHPRNTLQFPVYGHCTHAAGAPNSLYTDSVHFQPLLGNYIYSAYYDTRQPGGRHFIRIVALLKKLDKPALFCHFGADVSDPFGKDGGGGLYSTPVIHYYEMCENHAKDYGGWILSCEVPQQLKRPPCRIMVSIHSGYNPKRSGNVVLEVFTLSTDWAQKQDFGVCVPPLFGYIPSTTLIEFIELTRLLGADHVIFYLHQVTREVRKVLQYYEHIGAATMVDWKLPVADRAIWYHGQLVAINDCLYRGMHRFRYLTFNDIDEFIVPHAHANWSAMMTHIHGHSPHTPDIRSGLTFQSAFFDPLMSITSRALYDLESDLRTKSFSKVRSKVMVNPEQMYEVGIHHISKPLKDTFRPYYVDPQVGFVHHYRKCVTDFDPRMNCQVFARDESLSQYIPTLRHNVHQTLWILKEIEKNSHYRQHYYNEIDGQPT